MGKAETMLTTVSNGVGVELRLSMVKNQKILRKGIQCGFKQFRCLLVTDLSIELY